MTKKIIQTCDLVMEITWLLALVSIPIYFNIYTSRVFEPDKISLFRSLVLVMLVAWAAKGLAQLAMERESLARPAPGPRKGRPTEVAELVYPADGEIIGPDARPFPQNVIRRPLLLFSLFLSFVYTLSTVFSVVPNASWWGSYQRLEGTYTFLSYVSFFLVIVFNLRERRQLERLVSFVLLANIPVALYGILQHVKGDPLPWAGDTNFRVTSTMGNAIFISAYLIMVVPLIVYRAVTTGNWLFKNRATANKSFQGRQRNTALSWIALYGCFMLFLVGLFLVVLRFSADYRPEPTANTALAAETIARLTGSDSAAADSRALIGNGSIGPWWALPLGIVLSFGLFFLFTVRRRGTDTNYLFRLVEFGAYLSLLVIVALTTLYSQSRGPIAGVLVGLFIFFPILFWRRRAWKWLVGWLGLGLVGGIVLVLFNLPAGSTPLEGIFKIARQNEQIARLGQFAQTNDGTGKVRQLIWKTVLEAEQAAAQKDPLRLVVGYGPESLYNISPQHYQPELAQVEARNAIPDRSHNGYLDALVTTGVIGLVAYVGFVLAFLFYAFRFLRRTQRFEYQVLLAALIAAMLAHQVEIQTGIQIVSTWMMFWTLAAMLAVMGGLIYGRWDAIGSKADRNKENLVVPESMADGEEPEMVVAAKAPAKETDRLATGKSKTARARESVAVGPVRPGGSRPPTVPLGPGPRRNAGPVYATAATEQSYAAFDRPVRGWYWGAVGLVALVALVYGWFGNLLPVWADTVYKQGFSLAQSNEWQRATPYLQQAVLYAPTEDFYSLYLGQAYLESAQALATDARTDKTKLAQMQRYLLTSETELKRANSLAPLNPDHYANLGRLYTRWADLEPARAGEVLRKSIGAYEEVVTKYAPRNARLWAELASARATLAKVGQPANSFDKPLMDKAFEAGQESIKLDDHYDLNRLLLGEIYRIAGKNDEAGAQYLALAQIDPRQLASDEHFANRMQILAQSKLVVPDQAMAAFDPAKLDKSTGTTSADSNRGFAYLSQAMLSYYQNNLDAARNSLSQSLALTPDDPYAHAFLALVYQRTGQATQYQTEAAQARDAAAKVKSNPAQVKQAIEELLKGSN